GQGVFGDGIGGGEQSAEVAQEIVLRVARARRRRGLCRPAATAPHA
ncbi:MAG: hypothetical protein QOI64_1224, partial [Solirubrobacteraceae bacterium]|nr:hypothetical protein [Solirubrobacteraceae bacterium]